MKEELVKRTTQLFLGIALIDFALLIFKPIRDHHFDNFPNMHFIGITLLFLMVVARIYLAYKAGEDPHMESSRAWRARKDMLDPYDFMGPEPDYSNTMLNLIYFIGVIVSFVLIVLQMIEI